MNRHSKRVRATPPAVVALALALVASACGTSTDSAPSLRTGSWHGWLDSPGGELPFGLEISGGEDGRLLAVLLNGDERQDAGTIAVDGDAATWTVEPFGSTITATITEDGTRLDGEWRKRRGPDRWRVLPLHARAGAAPRFETAPGADGAPVSGRWAVDFSEDALPSVGLFRSRDGGRVDGTFLNATGDYRYLEGALDGDTLRLSVFDGAHAFLFRATLEGEELRGDFWSGDTWHETWTARRDAEAATVDGFAQTVWAGAPGETATYPDLDGAERSLDEFTGPRLLYVFGSWCPNCGDATRYLKELDERYGSRGLEIVGLAFEVSGDFETDAATVRRYAEHHGVSWPILLAGTSDKDAASASFTLIDRVRSYPTVIFVAADDSVAAIHSGFSGPATGEAYDRLRARFEERIEDLLAGA